MEKAEAALIKVLEDEDEKLDSNDRSFTERMGGKRKRDRHVTTRRRRLLAENAIWMRGGAA